MAATTQLFGRLQLALEEFRRVYPDANILTLQAFIAVANTPGKSNVDLCRDIHPQPSLSSLSRQLLLLSDQTWHGKKPGLDLIEAVSDPNDRRGKLTFLTAKGRSMAAAIARHLEPELKVTASDYTSSKTYLKNGA